MAFKIINNTKVDENRIEWKFEGLDPVYVSTADRLKRNIAFWQTKLNVGKDVKIEIINGVEFLYSHLETEKNIVDVEATEVLPNEATTDLSETLTSRLEENEFTITNDPAIESRVDEPTEQPTVSQDVESPVDTPKRKRRPKTS